MEFITFEDESGIFEVTMFPAVYARYNRLLGRFGPYKISGVVESSYGATTVTANHIEWIRPGHRKSA